MPAETPKDEHGHDMLSDEERVEHGFAVSYDPSDPRSRDAREAEASGDVPTPTARSARAPDAPEYSDEIEAQAYNNLRAGIPMTPLQIANRKLGEQEAEAKAKEAEAANTELKASRASAAPAETAPAPRASRAGS